MGVLYIAGVESDWFEERTHYRDTFTDTVSRDFELSAADVCFVAPLGEAIEYVCLVNRGDMVATLKRRVRFTDLVSLGHPISFDLLARKMPRNLFQHVAARRYSGGTVPPRTWDVLVETITALRPEAADEIRRIEELAREPLRGYGGPGADTLALERDALGLAMMAAEIDRTDLLTWQASGSQAPFLRGLRRKEPIEDRLIDYDASVFGRWALIHRDAAGVAVFAEGVHQLTVINANRTDIEHALGVDLVYYNHRFRSFVLVQYKRMRKESGRNVYRPDGSLEKELERMRALPVSRDVSDDPSEYRLHPGSCYLKLCPEGSFRPRDGELIRGMYLPLDFWDELVASGAVLGTRHRTAVTFENAERHVNSSLFAALIRDGWVGSRVESTELLEQVVEELLAEGHSVTLAEYKRTRSRQ